MPSNTPQRAEVAPFPGDCPESAAESPPGRCAYLGKRGRSTAVAVTLQSYHFHLFEGCEGQGGMQGAKREDEGERRPLCMKSKGVEQDRAGSSAWLPACRRCKRGRLGFSDFCCQLFRFALFVCSVALCISNCTLTVQKSSKNALQQCKKTAYNALRQCNFEEENDYAATLRIHESTACGC